MVVRPQPTASGGVSVHLLDSAQGHPIQTWRFSNQSEISIGRDDSNDIVISDPHVSRFHAKLVKLDDHWTLVSVGRHGTLVDDRLVVDYALRGQVVFRLGPTGPMLRFEKGEQAFNRSLTMDQIDPDALSLLNVDEQRKQQEVEDIVSSALFEQLRRQSERLKSAHRPTDM